MSRAYDFRSELKDSIVAAGVLTAAQIVIERQTDIFADIDEAVAQAGGIALSIAAMSGDHINPDSASIIFNTELLLTLWSVVEFDESTRPEESVHEALVKALHHTSLPSFSNVPKCHRLIKVVRFTDTPDDDYLRRDTIIKAPLYYL